MSTRASRPSGAKTKAASEEPSQTGIAAQGSRVRGGSRGQSHCAAYDLLAPFYEEHWGAAFVDGALAMYAEWLAPRLPASGAHVLDVCCGGGDFAAWLSLSHAVTGVDLSRGMLEQARIKAPRAEFVQGDMRTFRLPSGDFDAAVCFYNSVNQAMTARGLRNAFASIAAHLRQGAWLLFDFVEESAFLNTWEHDETAAADGRMIQLRYRYNPKTRIATCRGLVDGERMIVRQRSLDAAEVEDALDQAGLELDVLAPVTNVSPSRGRWVVLAHNRGT